VHGRRAGCRSPAVSRDEIDLPFVATSEDCRNTRHDRQVSPTGPRGQADQEPRHRPMITTIGIRDERRSARDLIRVEHRVRVARPRRRRRSRDSAFRPRRPRSFEREAACKRGVRTPHCGIPLSETSGAAEKAATNQTAGVQGATARRSSIARISPAARRAARRVVATHSFCNDRGPRWLFAPACPSPC